MPFALMVHRRKRDGDGQPMVMADGEPCHELRVHRFGLEYRHAQDACAKIGIGAELAALMAEDDMAADRSVEIPRRAITGLRIDVDAGRLNDALVRTDGLRLDALRDARLDLTDPEARVFLAVSAY
jgi:hypothetical protein